MDDPLVQLVKSNQSYSQFDSHSRYVTGTTRYDSINRSEKHDSKWESMYKWQNTWKLKFQNGLTFHFDNNSLISKNNNLKKINNLKILSLKKKILQKGGKIEPIINTLSIKNLDNFIMISNNEQYLINGIEIKIWDLDKLTRFLQIYETNLSQLTDQKKNNETSLSKDIIYFNESPHIYLFDLKQRYKPLICKKWDIGLVNKSKKEQLPYPHIQKNSTYGKCPFKPINSQSSNILIPMIDATLAKKRYSRDLINQRYALKLRKIYSKNAKPPLDLKNLITDLDLQESTNQILYDYFNHNCENSKKLINKFKFLQLKRFNTMDVNFKSFNENLDPLESLRNDLVKQKYESDSDLSNDSNNNNNDNDSLGSNDTVETLALSELSDDHEPRTSLTILKLDASIYNEQNDEIVVNTGFRSINKPIELRNAKIQFCENCHEIYNDTLNNHINTEKHKLYSMDDKQFSDIDKLINIIKT